MKKLSGRIRIIDRRSLIQTKKAEAEQWWEEKTQKQKDDFFARRWSKSCAKVLGSKLYKKWAPKSDKFNQDLYSLRKKIYKLKPMKIEKLHRAIYTESIYDDYHKKVANVYYTKLKNDHNLSSSIYGGKKLFLGSLKPLNEDPNQFALYGGKKVKNTYILDETKLRKKNSGIT